MKVIREGKAWVLQHECTGFGNEGKGCGALLEMERSDLRYFAGGGYMDRDPAVVFKCPCCKQTTDLGFDEWPPNPRALTPWTSEWRDE